MIHKIKLFPIHNWSLKDSLLLFLLLISNIGCCRCLNLGIAFLIGSKMHDVELLMIQVSGFGCSTLVGALLRKIGCDAGSRK